MDYPIIRDLSSTNLTNVHLDRELQLAETSYKFSGERHGD
jgi:hypothetical protein